MARRNPRKEPFRINDLLNCLNDIICYAAHFKDQTDGLWSSYTEQRLSPDHISWSKEELVTCLEKVQGNRSENTLLTVEQTRLLIESAANCALRILNEDDGK